MFDVFKFIDYPIINSIKLSDINQCIFDTPSKTIGTYNVILNNIDFSKNNIDYNQIREVVSKLTFYYRKPLIITIPLSTIYNCKDALESICKLFIYPFILCIDITNMEYDKNNIKSYFTNLILLLDYLNKYSNYFNTFGLKIKIMKNMSNIRNTIKHMNDYPLIKFIILDTTEYLEDNIDNDKYDIKKIISKNINTINKFTLYSNYLITETSNSNISCYLTHESKNIEKKNIIDEPQVIHSRFTHSNL